jgi:hypothetical protein
MRFKSFLLCEENEYFGSKIGDILNALQELSQGAQNMGSRHLTRLIQAICNEIRGVLRSRWSMRQRPYLEQLQRVGVALMKAIEEQGDMPGTLASAQHELETMSGKLGVPLNQMGSGLAETTLFG